MNENFRLCLNLHAVRAAMRAKKLTRKKLCQAIGIQDPHTLAYYLNNPDLIRLNHITAIANVLGSTPYPCDEFIVMISSDEEYAKLISGDE